jgi:hypothetical protein
MCLLCVVRTCNALRRMRCGDACGADGARSEHDCVGQGAAYVRVSTLSQPKAAVCLHPQRRAALKRTNAAAIIIIIIINLATCYKRIARYGSARLVASSRDVSVEIFQIIGRCGSIPREPSIYCVRRPFDGEVAADSFPETGTIA